MSAWVVLHIVLSLEYNRGELKRTTFNSEKADQ